MAEGLPIGWRNRVATLTPESGTHPEETLRERQFYRGRMNKICQKEHKIVQMDDGNKTIGKIRMEELRASAG